MRTLHPTSRELLQTATQLLEEHSPDDITVDMVLSRSGVSKGSMYHHYRDFAELLDTAQVARFAALVDSSIEMIGAVVHSSRSREQYYEGMVRVTAATQAPAAAASRSTRIWTLGQATLRQSMRDALGAEQQRLTDAITELVSESQARGWVRRELDPRAVAVFIQAYTLGRAVDDVTPSQVDPGSWEQLVNIVIAEVLLGDRSLADRAPSIPRQP